MSTAILEPCPQARQVKRTIAGRWRYEFKCQTLCPLCRGTASVFTCPDCQGCGLKPGGTRCERCSARGKLPGALA